MSSPRARRITMLVRNRFTNDTRVEREAETLVDAGYRVTIVAEADPGLPLREERLGATVIRVRRRIPDLPLLRFVAHLWRLRRAVQRTRPDILHAHDTDALQVMGPIGLSSNLPVVFDSHELWLGDSARGRNAIYHRAAQAYYGWVERRFVRRAAAVIVANPPVAAELEARYGVLHVVAVPNYPTLERLEPRDLRDLDGGHVIPRDVPIVLYVGQMSPERGIEQLVDCMVDVPTAHLAFLGGGGLEPDIRARAELRGIAHRTHFLGMVPSDDVVGYSASATVGIISSLPTNLNNRLALPNKLFQYMAASVPVVASDYPQIREIVAGSQCGVVVDPTDHDGLVAAIRAYTEDPARAAREGQNGRRAVTERYHWDAAAEKLIAVYRGLEGKA